MCSILADQKFKCMLYVMQGALTAGRKVQSIRSHIEMRSVEIAFVASLRSWFEQHHDCWQNTYLTKAPAAC